MQRIDCTTDRSYGTPLHWTTMSGKVRTMTALLVAGAQIEATNAWQRTPLHNAASFRHEEAVRLLVGRGVNKEAPRDTNETPLYFAVKHEPL